MQTRNQKFAADIFRQVEPLKPADNESSTQKDIRQQYGSMAHKLPVLIRTAGLVQALVFAESRKKDGINQLLNHLAEATGNTNKATLINNSRLASLSEYMRLTQQTLDALLWYKRFAQSVLDVDATEEDDKR